MQAANPSRHISFAVFDVAEVISYDAVMSFSSCENTNENAGKAAPSTAAHIRPKIIKIRSYNVE